MKENTINFKEKININNKLNLPTILTKKKMASLLLMSWLSVNGANGGQTFKDCLIANNATIGASVYNSLTTFPFFNYNESLIGSEWLHLVVCCDKLPCSPLVIPIGNSCNDIAGEFNCFKINQTIFCNNCPQSQCTCGGIVDNTNITGDYVSNATVCPDLQLVTNDLTIVTPKHGQVEWSCVGIKNCPSQGFMNCQWDNNGWTCIYIPCYLQWPASFPNIVTSSSTPITSASSILTSTSSINSYPLLTPTTTPLLDDNSHLTEKIAIPIGTIVGVATISGVTYYLICQKKKKKLLLIAGNREQQTVNNQNEPTTTNEILTLTSQIKALPELPVQGFNFQTKNNELVQLIQQTKNKIGSNLEIALETLLDTQSEITKGNNVFAIRQLQREAKEKLLTKLSLEEINNLCQLQSEVIQQQLQQEQELTAQIEVNPYGQEVRKLGREL